VVLEQCRGSPCAVRAGEVEHLGPGVRCVHAGEVEVRAGCAASRTVGCCVHRCVICLVAPTSLSHRVAVTEWVVSTLCSS
jgi:hypothetical protein